MATGSGLVEMIISTAEEEMPEVGRRIALESVVSTLLSNSTRKSRNLVVAGMWRSNITQEALVLGAEKEVGGLVGRAKASFLLAVGFRIKKGEDESPEELNSFRLSK